MTEPMGDQHAAYRLRLIAGALHDLWRQGVNPELVLAIGEINEVARRLEAAHEARVSATIRKALRS